MAMLPHHKNEFETSDLRAVSEVISHPITITSKAIDFPVDLEDRRDIRATFPDQVQISPFALLHCRPGSEIVRVGTSPLSRKL
jgi:hypothetical protein